MTFKTRYKRYLFATVPVNYEQRWNSLTLCERAVSDQSKQRNKNEPVYEAATSFYPLGLYAIFRASVSAFAWRGSGEPFWKPHLNTPNLYLNLKLFVIGSLVYSESSTLDHVGTKAVYCEIAALDHSGYCHCSHFPVGIFVHYRDTGRSLRKGAGGSVRERSFAEHVISPGSALDWNREFSELIAFRVQADYTQPLINQMDVFYDLLVALHSGYLTRGQPTNENVLFGLRARDDEARQHRVFAKDAGIREHYYFNAPSNHPTPTLSDPDNLPMVIADRSSDVSLTSYVKLDHKDVAGGGNN
uniref:(California timema) hypothetical protein n=1 Tax=Timema californicum TaxID=61474 RepID=A0A7R9J7K8_TIMCA|nr:unnamed protein product [Timema californicum]